MLHKSQHIVSVCVVAVLAVLSNPAAAQVRFSDRLQTQAAGKSNSISSQKELIKQQIANGTFKIGHSPKLNKHGPPPDTSQLVLPHWTSSFKYEGVTYPFTVIGGDPSAQQTTHIPTVVIPYRFVFSDGTAIDATTDVIDGSNALDLALASPIFNNAPFASGPTSLGNTQWGDAYMRGNFWSVDGGQNSEYHTLLDVVWVAPLQIIDVPPDAGFTLNIGGELVGFADFSFIDITTINTIYAFGIPPGVLSINIAGELITIQHTGPAALGFHYYWDLSPATGVPGVSTYIQTGVFPLDSAAVRTNARGGAVLAHEVVEWLMDPEVNNLVPTWGDPYIPNYCWNPAMEVADPIEQFDDTTMSFNGHTYFFPDVAFLPWFSRTPTKFSVNGWYSLNDTLTSYAQKCPFFQSTVYFYFPNDPPGLQGALTSMNTRKQAAGYFTLGGGEFGFVFENVDPFNPGGVITITGVNVPGGVFGTYPLKINDAGQVVGVYFDAGGNEHGFLESLGGYTTIDYPGAIATEARAINNKNHPTIAGDYIDTSGIVHPFTLINGVFQTIDVPFGVNAAITGINVSNEIVGTWDNGPGTLTHSFIGNFGATYVLNFNGATYVDTIAGGINDAGQVGGSYVVHGTLLGPGDISHGFLFGAGDFVPADLSFFDDDQVTTINDINAQGYVAGSFIAPDGSGVTAMFGLPYNTLFPQATANGPVPIALPAGAFGPH
jgi:hypothetical protein